MHTIYSSKSSLFIVLLISLLTTSYAAGTLQISSSQLQINSSPVIYSFALGAISFTTIPSGSTINVDFPSDYAGILPSPPSCQDDSGNTLTCTISSQRITITNYFSSAAFDNTFKFKITTLKNPSHTGSTGTFTASIVNPSSVTLVDGTATISITEATSTCSANTASNVIGATTTITFSIITTTAIPANGGLQIIFPWWSQSGESMIVSPLTCSVTSPSASTPGSCTTQTVSNGNQLLALSMPNAVSAGATLTFQLQSIRNPPVATAKTVTIRTLDTSSLGLDNCTVSIQATTPNSIVVNSGSFLTCVTNSNVKKINTQETCILSFTTTNPLPSGSTINVRFPTEVGLSASYRVNEDRPYSISSLSISSSSVFPDVLVTNGVTSYTAGSTAVDLRFISMIHPSTTKPTSSFQITTYYGGSAIDTITSGVTYSASAGDLSTVTVTASPSQAGSVSDVTFNFSVGNSVSSSSQIVIVFPTEFTTDAGTVTCTGSGTKMNSSPTCSMSSKTLTISSYASATITSSDTVTIIVHNIGLPKTTKPTTTTFDVSTMDGGYMVDRNTLTYFSSTAASITSGLSVSVSSGALVGGISDYTIAFQPKNPIPANGQIQVGLPADGTITISNSLSVQTGTQILVGSSTMTPSSTVGTALSVPTVTFTNPFSTIIAAGTTVKITIPSLNNPPSTAITNSFAVKTLTSDNYAIDYTNTGLNLLANVISPSDFQSVSVSPSPTTTGSDSSYTFNIVPTVAHTASHSLTITFPTSITFKSSPTCTVTKPVSQSAVSCIPNSLNVMTISMGQAVAALATFQMSVSGITNPIDSGTYSGFSLATTISTAKVHQSTGTISMTITPSVITSATLSRSSKVPSQPAVYTFDLTPINQYPTTAFIEVVVPSQLSVSTASTLKCADLLGFGSTPTCQLKSGSTNTVWITGGGAYSKTRLRFSLDSIVNQGSQIDSDSFIIYFKETATEAIIDQVTSGLVSLSPCDPSCLTCLDTSRTSCTSCDTSLLHDLVNSKCVSNCPGGTYKDGTECKGCNSKCLTCSGSSETQCSTCNTTSTYSEFYLNQCLSQCPSKFYSDASHNCQGCVSPCETCSSVSACKTCDSSNFYYNGVCNTYCPIGYYKDTNSRSCLQCNSNCKTCSSSTGCDSCDTSSTSSYPIFYNNNCLNKCVDGTYTTGSTCQSCTSPCLTCTLTATNCLTCTPGLFASNGACTTCDSSCKTCSGTFDSCTTCATGLVLQGTRCISSCSEGYYADTALQVCQKCPSTCQTCSSLTKCTSCAVGSSTPYMYDGACVGSCPTEASTLVGRTCTTTNSSTPTTVVVSTVTERVNPYDGLYRTGLPVPFLIMSLVFCVLSFVGRMIVARTLVVSNILGFVSLLEFGAWVALAVLLILSHLDDSLANYTGFPFVLFGIFASFVINIIFFFRVLRPLVKSESVVTWKSKKRLNRAFLIIGQIFALITFKSFRLIFSRFFGLEAMSLVLNDVETFFSTFHKYLGLNFFFSVLPAFIAAVITIHKDSAFSQLLNISLEVILISLVTVSLTIFEALRPNEWFKKAEVVPDQTNLVGSVLEDSVLNKLNEEEEANRRENGAKAHAAKGSQIIEDIGEDDDEKERNENENLNELNQSSSFINLNNTMTEKRAEREAGDLLGEVEGQAENQPESELMDIENQNENENENEDENENNNNEKSQIEAIEEIEKDDDDEEPTLNLKSKTMGRLQEILKERGHEFMPEKLLIENKDGSIIVVKGAGMTKKGRKKENKDDGGNESPGSGNEQEDSEQELELHDSFEDVGEKMEASKKIGGVNNEVQQPNNADQEANLVRDSKELKVSTDGLLKKEEEGKGDDFEVVDTPQTGDVVNVDSADANDMSPELRLNELRKSAMGMEKKEEVADQKKEHDGFEYVSSDSQGSVNDMHNHFMDDTPSNYNVLNQRYDEEFVSPAVLVTKRTMSEVADNNFKNGTPQKPVIMQSNFMENRPQTHQTERLKSAMKDLPPRSTFHSEQQASKTSYGKPMIGEKSRIMEAGMRLVTPQSGQTRMISDAGRGQSNQSSRTGHGRNGSIERRRDDFGSMKDNKNGRTSEKNSSERINELEGLYMNKKKEVPSIKSSLSKISKKQVNAQKSIDDDMDIDELELNNFEKFEDFVNGMKRQSSVQRIEADSFDRENV